MQLLLLLALLLYGGNNNAGGPLKQFRPLLEKFGGYEVKQALKSADEFEEIISAFGNLSAGGEKKARRPCICRSRRWRTPRRGRCRRQCG